MLPTLIARCLAVPMFADWSYDDLTGPHRWATLDPQWAANVGDRQSPIDLPSGAPAGYAPLELDHRRAESVVTIDHQSLRIDIEGTQRVVFGGTDYTLDHIHFHTASEHSVDGELADGEAHLVHADAYGRLLVLGVLIEAGSHSAALDSVLEGATSFDPVSLLPPDGTPFWTYQGSLTTPPLTENVTWVVFARRHSVSDEQLSRLEAICHGNRRPVQPSNGRRVERIGSPS